MEHAYAPEEIGLIEVSLVEREGVYCLTIQDEGRGFDVTQYYATLGLTLMEDITTSLPCGHLDIQVTKGTQVRVRFQLEERC
jgi:two-component sensor histidine kinase